MKKLIRIIPRLDIKGPNLVKGIHLEGLRVLGKPEDFARFYYQLGADELIYQDIVASLYERNSLTDIISKTAKELFIPLTVGGGIRNLNDINKVLRAGADKVSINTAALKNPKFIEEAAKEFGSSTIVIAIETIKDRSGKYFAYYDNGREFSGVDIFDWVKRVYDLGAGEIMITSVDKDGTGEGFDIELISKIVSLVEIPVIAHGGAGKKEHILELLNACDVSGVVLASILHYKIIEYLTINNKNYQEGNLDFLKNNYKIKNIIPEKLDVIKEYLRLNNLNIR